MSVSHLSNEKPPHAHFADAYNLIRFDGCDKKIIFPKLLCYCGLLARKKSNTNKNIKVSAVWKGFSHCNLNGRCELKFRSKFDYTMQFVTEWTTKYQL